MKLSDAKDLLFQGDRVKRVYLGSEEVYRWSGREVSLVVGQSNLDDILVNPTNWIYDINRGWYRDVYLWDIGIDIVFDKRQLSEITKIGGYFTSRFSTPDGSLGQNTIAITLDDDSVYRVGTRDAWTQNEQHHVIYDPDSGLDGVKYPSDVNERYMSFTVPEGRYIVNLKILPHGFESGGTQYPFTERGFKDLTFDFFYV